MYMKGGSGVAPEQGKVGAGGYEDRPADERELNEMKRLIAEAMEQGAVGLTSAWHGGGFSYPEEMFEMARVAAGYGGYYGTHVGSEGFEPELELEKAIRLGETAGMPGPVYHLKLPGPPNRGKDAPATALHRAARARWAGSPAGAPGGRYRAACRRRRTSRRGRDGGRHRAGSGHRPGRR